MFLDPDPELLKSRSRIRNNSFRIQSMRVVHLCACTWAQCCGAGGDYCSAPLDQLTKYPIFIEFDQHFKINFSVLRDLMILKYYGIFVRP